MNNSTVLTIAVKTLLEAGELAAPMLLTSMAIGIGISLLQSITQISEATLTFVPKLAGISLVIVVAGHWMLDSLVGFTESMYQLIPALLNAA